MPADRTVMRRLFSTLGCALVLGLPAVAVAECTLNVVNVSFGSYDIFSALDSQITGSVNVTCDVESNLQVSVSTGLGSYSARQMASGANALYYNLFMDPTHLTIWGDGSPGTGFLALSGMGGNFPVYGRIPAGQNVPVGAYGDTLIVTLTF